MAAAVCEIENCGVLAARLAASVPQCALACVTETWQRYRFFSGWR